MSPDDRTKIEQLRDACTAALAGEPIQFKHFTGDWVHCDGEWMAKNPEHTFRRKPPKPQRIWVLKDSAGEIGTVGTYYRSPQSVPCKEFVEVLK